MIYEPLDNFSCPARDRVQSARVGDKVRFPEDFELSAKKAPSVGLRDDPERSISQPEPNRIHKHLRDFYGSKAMQRLFSMQHNPS